MENEVIQTVRAEVLEELKEVIQQQVATTKALLELQENLAGFEVNLNSIIIAAPAVVLGP